MGVLITISESSYHGCLDNVFLGHLVMGVLIMMMDVPITISESSYHGCLDNVTESPCHGCFDNDGCLDNDKK
jgi:hypothetical protein